VWPPVLCVRGGVCVAVSVGFGRCTPWRVGLVQGGRGVLAAKGSSFGRCLGALFVLVGVTIEWELTGGSVGGYWVGGVVD